MTSVGPQEIFQTAKMCATQQSSALEPLLRQRTRTVSVLAPPKTNGHDRHSHNGQSKAAKPISARLKSASLDDAVPFRQAPHNLEAEQALLGAILVNNEAIAPVSSFLEPHHFFDPLHQQIFETAAKIIHAGKNATPITLRTFFERAEPISPNLTVPQYLGTLTANATTIINAEDYGRTVYDLATRRALIIMLLSVLPSASNSQIRVPRSSQYICKEHTDLPSERTIRRWALDPEHPFSPQYARAERSATTKWRMTSLILPTTRRRSPAMWRGIGCAPISASGCSARRCPRSMATRSSSAATSTSRTKTV